MPEVSETTNGGDKKEFVTNMTFHYFLNDYLIYRTQIFYPVTSLESLIFIPDKRHFFPI